ncbi:replication initiation and membrane attachment family protein [Desemzia sp. FAM 23991]|uniref:replication initiation and membrane attachment family protein n=1 Tax=unclassified Desemzia TaxID=2685243 RepID=UPI00388490F4
MSYPWKNLSPKDGFMVKQSALLSDIDQQILTFLYQPLIGSAAYSLYMTLWTETEKDTFWSEGILHAELLSLLNLGMPEVYQARIRLEAIGLLKTFVQTEPEKLYVYELQKPQTSKAFFEEDLFSLLLLERVGERKFKQLRNRFSVQPINKDQYAEITKSFLDVYHMNTDQLKQHETLFKSSRSLIGDAAESAVTLNADTFDWNFFYNGLNQHYVNRSAITADIRETILTLHHMYAINELAMQHYILEASDMDTGVIDARKLKKNIVDDFHRENKEKIQLQDVVQQELEVTTATQSQREQDLKHQGFSDSDIQVIEASKQYSPAEFMNDIKEQKNGYISKPEEWTLEDIVKKSHLSNPVINILIHYILVVQGKVVFEKGLAYTISNDWAQNEIKTPEAALKKVRDLYQENAEKYQKNQDRKQNTSAARSNNNYSRNKNVVRKEKLPDWAKEGYQTPKETSISPEAEKQLQERLARIQNMQKEGE